MNILPFKANVGLHFRIAKSKSSMLASVVGLSKDPQQRRCGIKTFFVPMIEQELSDFFLA